MSSSCCRIWCSHRRGSLRHHSTHFHGPSDVITTALSVLRDVDDGADHAIDSLRLLGELYHTSAHEQSKNTRLSTRNRYLVLSGNFSPVKGVHCALWRELETRQANLTPPGGSVRFLTLRVYGDFMFAAPSHHTSPRSPKLTPYIHNMMSRASLCAWFLDIAA